MPTMPRPSGKAKRIAYSILGTPEAEKKKNRKNNAIKRRIIRSEISMVK